MLPPRFLIGTFKQREVGKKRQTWVLRNGGFQFGGQREGRAEGREGDSGRCCTGTDSNTDEKEKEEKEAGNKKRRGEEKTREAGEKDGGMGKVRRVKEKTSRKGERGDQERPGEGRERKRRDERGERRVSTLPKKWKECVCQVMSARRSEERGATGGQRAGGK
jgi:hypothetical protein